MSNDNNTVNDNAVENNSISNNSTSRNLNKKLLEDKLKILANLIVLVPKTFIVAVVFVYTIIAIDNFNEKLGIARNTQQVSTTKAEAAKAENSYEQLKTLIKECIGAKPDPTPTPPPKTTYQKLKDLIGVE
jgi:DNA-binding SARP family transcriptional activator